VIHNLKAVTLFMCALALLVQAQNGLAACDEKCAEQLRNRGVRSLYGVLAEKNVSRGIRLLEKSAEIGNTEAMFNLGQYYVRHSTRDDRWARAIRWFKMAADNDYAEAHFGLAKIYEERFSEDTYSSKALDHYQRAYNLGSVKAGCSLGVHLLNDDNPKAKEYIRKAARAGSGHCQYNLAVMYSNGHLIKEDDGCSRYWAEKALNNGFVEARKLLGK